MGGDLHTMAIVTAAIYYRMAPLKRLDAEANKSFFIHCHLIYFQSEQLTL